MAKKQLDSLVAMIEDALRAEVKLVPDVVIRELVANALIQRYLPFWA